MKQLVQNFPNQLQEAMTIGQNYRFLTAKKTFSNVVLTGLGGSGIGGSIIQNFVFDKLSVPFIVNKAYTLPSFVDSETLVIVSSYSGNTEETLAAMKQALKAKATIICVTSGGKVADIAKKKNLDCILLPAGMPPRSCLGYSMTQLLYILNHFKMIKGGYEKELKSSINMLQADSRSIQAKARALAKKINGRLPIIYTSADYEGVAVRFRQQLNENSKVLCWHHVIPEMNHNELVGWRDNADDKIVLILRNENDYNRVQLRIEINKKIIKKYTKNIVEVYSKGKSYWERVFYLIHLTDWVSVYLAELRNQDPVEVNVIDYLKGALAKS